MTILMHMDVKRALDGGHRDIHHQEVTRQSDIDVDSADGEEVVRHAGHIIGRRRDQISQLLYGQVATILRR
jgi:hypothetical protein